MPDDEHPDEAAGGSVSAGSPLQPPAQPEPEVLAPDDGQAPVAGHPVPYQLPTPEGSAMDLARAFTYAVNPTLMEDQARAETGVRLAAAEYTRAKARQADIESQVSLAVGLAKARQTDTESQVSLAVGLAEAEIKREAAVAHRIKNEHEHRLAPVRIWRELGVPLVGVVLIIVGLLLLGRAVFADAFSAGVLLVGLLITVVGCALAFGSQYMAKLLETVGKKAGGD